MTQREQIEALRTEVAELREKVAALEAAQGGTHHHYHYAPPVPAPVPTTPFVPWSQPWSSPNICQASTAGGVLS